jgi:anti-sigma regulatory factor (Ser/Thr protein kinase)
MHFNLKTKFLLDDIHCWVKIQAPKLSEIEYENIKIALGEALQNVIRHGYKNKLNEEDYIDIEYQKHHDRLTFKLRDYAEPCNPASFLNKSFSPNESGHMGLSIIRNLTDEFTIQPIKDGNETILVFKINNT